MICAAVLCQQQNADPADLRRLCQKNCLHAFFGDYILYFHIGNDNVRKFFLFYRSVRFIDRQILRTADFSVSFDFYRRIVYRNQIPLYRIFLYQNPCNRTVLPNQVADMADRKKNLIRRRLRIFAGRQGKFFGQSFRIFACPHRIFSRRKLEFIRFMFQQKRNRFIFCFLYIYVREDCRFTFQIADSYNPVFSDIKSHCSHRQNLKVRKRHTIGSGRTYQRIVFLF